VAGCPAAAYAKAFCNFQALLTEVKMTSMLQKAPDRDVQKQV
jgi:hypothetical protein